MSTDDAVEQDVNGTIESIEVQDFMCHKNQKWYFSPRMTFITGPNGSGKSAILTALQVSKEVIRMIFAGCFWYSSKCDWESKSL